MRATTGIIVKLLVNQATFVGAARTAVAAALKDGAILPNN